jgi:hypothetical protein
VTTVSTVTNLSQMGGAAIAMGAGARSAGTQRVTIATDDVVPISAAALPLPSGAATAAKQPALGTAGTASADVLSVQGIASGTPLGVGGTGAVPTATPPGPPATTAYAANDTISNSTSAPTVLTFAGMARTNAGTGYVVKARALTSQTTNTARLRLHLYKISPTAINDNAGCTAPLYADDAKYIGFVDFPAMQTGGGTPTAAFAISDGVRLHFKADTADTALYGLLQTLDAFTPASAQTFTITLSAEQD